MPKLAVSHHFGYQYYILASPSLRSGNASVILVTVLNNTFSDLLSSIVNEPWPKAAARVVQSGPKLRYFNRFLRPTKQHFIQIRSFGMSLGCTNLRINTDLVNVVLNTTVSFYILAYSLCSHIFGGDISYVWNKSQPVYVLISSLGTSKVKYSQSLFRKFLRYDLISLLITIR
jgi:hypothetical protein